MLYQAGPASMNLRGRKVHNYYVYRKKHTSVSMLPSFLICVYVHAQSPIVFRLSYLQESVHRLAD